MSRAMSIPWVARSRTSYHRAIAACASRPSASRQLSSGRGKSASALMSNSDEDFPLLAPRLPPADGPPGDGNATDGSGSAPAQPQRGRRILAARHELRENPQSEFDRFASRAASSVSLVIEMQTDVKSSTTALGFRSAAVDAFSYFR